jgi:hypothetical protein
MVISLIKKLDDIEMKLCLQQINVNSYETAKIFRFYFIDPIIKQQNLNKRTRFQTWMESTSNQ